MLQNVTKTLRTIELKKKTLKYSRTECYQSSKSPLNKRQKKTFQILMSVLVLRLILVALAEVKFVVDGLMLMLSYQVRRDY